MSAETNIDEEEPESDHEANAARAMAGMAAGQASRAVCDGDGDLRTGLIDVLSNLMHFADAQDLDFQSCLRMAGMHYEAEYDGC